jgi:hypothetical protein
LGSQLLYDVAYHLPHKINDIISNEVMKINLFVCDNRKTYCQLSTILNKDNYMKEQGGLQIWKDLVKEWKRLKLQQAEESFKEFLESDEMASPHSLRALQSDLITKQSNMKQQLMSHLEHLSESGPPHVTKAKIYEWKDKYTQLYEQLEHIQSDFMDMWYEAHQKIYSYIEHRMANDIAHLVSCSVLDIDESQQVTNDSLMPHMAKYQSLSTKHTTVIEKSLSSLLAVIHTKFLSIFQFAQGVCHIWDTHHLQLEDVSRRNEENLTNIRERHDSENQTREANLDYVLDRLRQSGTDIELSEYLKQSLDMLEAIKAGYVSFHELMVAETFKFSPVVKEELENYDKTLCGYFGVNRIKSKIRKKGKAASSYQKRSDPLHHANTPLSSPPIHPPTSMSSIIEHVISITDGTSFYIVQNEDDASGMTPPTAFLTQNEDDNEDVLSFATPSLTISETLFITVKERLRLLFLDHLEIWKKHQVSLVETLAEGKREELKTELELSLHLHKPRSVRITNDIHDVRKVELHDHQSRISVHIKGLTDELREQKELIISLWDYLDEMISKCSESLSAFHNELSQCSTVLSLKKALTGAEDIYDKNAAEFNEVYNARYELLVGKITSLAEANSEYISSLKLFSDGGNYTNNEISQFKPKLEKQGERINKYWTQCKEELEAIQQLRKERFDIIQMTKITNE